MPIVLPYDKKLYTPLGMSKADLIWIPDGVEDQSEYHCWQMETNEPWWWPQQYVRQVESFTGMQHRLHSEIVVSDNLIVSYLEAILRHKKSPFYPQAKRIIDLKQS